MKLKQWLRYLVAMLLCVWLIGLYWYQRPSAKQQTETRCSFMAQRCELTWGDHQKFTLTLKGDPSPLHPFEVEVDHLEVSALNISFAMSGMEMGSNTFVMKPVGGGRWIGRVVLPVCIQRRHDWRITVFNQQHAIVITTSFSSGAVQ